MRRQRPILVCEEDEQFRQLLERWLREAGHAVITDAPPAAAEQPCLVIANVASPRSAHAVLDPLRAVYAAPILVLSGRFRRGLAGSSEAARRLGVSKVLPKPFTRKELLSAVREALASKA